MNTALALGAHWQEIVSAVHYCTGVTLDLIHPATLNAIGHWAKGLISDDDFARVFSLPNSSYGDAGSCVINALWGKPA